jgi:hypothetical protein
MEQESSTVSWKEEISSDGQLSRRRQGMKMVQRWPENQEICHLRNCHRCKKQEFNVLKDVHCSWRSKVKTPDTNQQ